MSSIIKLNEIIAPDEDRSLNLLGAENTIVGKILLRFGLTSYHTRWSDGKSVDGGSASARLYFLPYKQE